nr:hypothetical protein [Tanacetum cinerariifolium]
MHAAGPEGRPGACGQFHGSRVAPDHLPHRHGRSCRLQRGLSALFRQALAGACRRRRGRIGRGRHARRSDRDGCQGLITGVSGVGIQCADAIGQQTGAGQAPARDVAIAREAILHGADAIYIGGPSFGARHNAANEVSEIAGLVEFARRYHARVFTTINTILHDNELEPARKLIHQLYDAGVDALIVQDLGVMELDIPPIELHASTQTDIRTLERARFLDQAGFSQLVLARELNLQEIRAIADETDAAIEFFIHGALCVAFSGQCNISHAQTGRSANRGDCSQACRLPYTLKDDQGRVVAYEKHLLSMKDNNQSANLRALVDAGVRSFKIEGRYKDMGYVKNITAYYRQRLDDILEDRPDLARASSGRTAHFFLPDPDKTFHRGSTDYFVSDRKIDIGAFDSPTFTGLLVGVVEKVGKRDLQVVTHEPLSNGDGLNVLVKREVVGFRANIAEPKGEFEEDGEKRYRYRVEPNEMPKGLQLRPNHPLSRNLDHNWQQALQKTSAERRIGVSWVARLREDALELVATSEEGISARAHPRGARKPETSPPPVYPEAHLSFLANVYNEKARHFYHRHGVQLIDAAYEAHEETGEVPVMITKHCLRFSFNLADIEVRLQAVRDARHWQDQRPHPGLAATWQRRAGGRAYQPGRPDENHSPRAALILTP